MAIYSKFWRGNNGVLTTNTLTVAVPDATPGKKLVALLQSRFGGNDAYTYNWPNARIYQSGSGNTSCMSVEKVADGNDDLTFNTNGNNRSISILIVQLDQVDPDVISDFSYGSHGTAQGWASRNYAQTGSSTQAEDGVAIALLSPRDTQDWATTGGSDNGTQISIDGPYTDALYSYLQAGNSVLTGMAFQEYTAGTIAEQQWDTSLNVTDMVFGGALYFPLAAGGAPESIYQEGYVTDIRLGSAQCTEVYKGAQLIWPASPTVNAYDQAVIDLSPDAYYIMDETSGDLTPTVGSDTLVASGTITYDNPPAFGFTEGLISYDNNQAVHYSSGANVIPPSAYSFSCVLRIELLEIYQQVFGRIGLPLNNSGGYGFGMFNGSDASESIWYEWTNSTNRNLTSNVGVRQGDDVHLVAVIEYGQPTAFYVNGVKFTTVANWNAVSAVASEYLIGNFYSSGNTTYSVSPLGRMAFYPRALSDAEAQTLWDAVPT